MKKLFLTAILGFCTFNVISAKAKIPVGEREVLNKVHDLPNTEEFKLENGNFLDLATLHKEFNIAYILPLWITEDSIIVGYDEKTGEFYDIPENELNAILASQKIKKEEINKLPFYTQYGGKLVALIIIALMIYGALPSKKEKIEPKQI